MKIVLDTNVVVSGLLTPFGPSGEIVRMVSAGMLILHYDPRIIHEIGIAIDLDDGPFTVTGRHPGPDRVFCVNCKKSVVIK